jgi:hypothetical protein
MGAQTIAFSFVYLLDRTNTSCAACRPAAEIAPTDVGDDSGRSGKAPVAGSRPFRACVRACDALRSKRLLVVGTFAEKRKYMLSTQHVYIYITGINSFLVRFSGGTPPDPLGSLREVMGEQIQQLSRLLDRIER